MQVEPIKTYTELSKLKTFEDRFNYLKIGGQVGEETFGFDRYLNQTLYNSPEWRKVRRDVLIRDEGRDLGIEGEEIAKYALIHHMNPITERQILDRDPEIFNPEYLITVSRKTHNAIHYGDIELLRNEIVERTPNDTCPWKRS